MVSCILLSAGESRRFGSPKALVDLRGTTAIGTIQQTLVDCRVDEVIVVLGAQANLIEPHVFNHNKVRVVHNKDYKLGQTSSFQAGVASVDKNASGILLLPVDCPFVRGTTIDKIIEDFTKTNPSILVPVCGGRRGHPPVFNVSLKQEILDLPTDQGINVLFERFPPVTIEINDPGILRTFNTPQEIRGHPP